MLQWQTYRRRHNCITQPCHSAITLLSRTVIGRPWSLTVTLQLAETLTQEWPDVDQSISIEPTVQLGAAAHRISIPSKHCLRCWPSIKPALGQHFVFASKGHCSTSSPNGDNCLGKNLLLRALFQYDWSTNCDVGLTLKQNSVTSSFVFYTEYVFRPKYM